MKVNTGPVIPKINDGIPKDLCSLHYINVDNVIRQIIALGRGALLAKADIKSAFRLLPVHPADRHLLGMLWNDELYIDTCLLFWVRSAPKLFNILADFLAWILQHQGVFPIFHYLDDFLIITPPVFNTCLQHLNHFKQACHTLGVPLALEKKLDTHLIEARLPKEKLLRLHATVTEWVSRKNAAKEKFYL